MNEARGRAVKRFLPAKPSTVETDTRGQVGMVKLGACWQQEIELRLFWGKPQPGNWLKTSTYQGPRMKKKYAIFDVILVSLLDPALPSSASLLGLLAKIKV